MPTDRYHRQTLVTTVGSQGQRHLGESTVLIVGCGALGSGSADLLARAGVGRLRLVDRDVVELTTAGSVRRTGCPGRHSQSCRGTEQTASHQLGHQHRIRRR